MIWIMAHMIGILLSLYAIWADRMNNLPEYDSIPMCKFADRLLNNYSKWDELTKQYFCWLAKNLKCPSFSGKYNDIVQKAIQSKECQEFLLETEKILS